MANYTFLQCLRITKLPSRRCRTSRAAFLYPLQLRPPAISRWTTQKKKKSKNRLIQKHYRHNRRPLCTVYRNPRVRKLMQVHTYLYWPVYIPITINCKYRITYCVNIISKTERNFMNKNNAVVKFTQKKITQTSKCLY